jgi:hypothetical protein
MEFLETAERVAKNRITAWHQADGISPCASFLMTTGTGLSQAGVPFRPCIHIFVGYIALPFPVDLLADAMLEHHVILGKYIVEFRSIGIAA